MTDLQTQAQVAAIALLDNVTDRDAKCTSLYLSSLPGEIKEVIFLGGTQGSPYNAPDGVNELIPVVCEKGDLELLELLLSVGADPKSRGAKGTPIELATLHNHKHLVDRLIEANPDIIKDPSGVKACLSKACETKNPEMVELWLGYLNSLYSEKSTLSSGGARSPDINVDPQSFGQDLAGHRLQGDSFYITKDTVKYAGDVLTHVLEVWVEEEEVDAAGTKKLAANWEQKHLYTFEQHWLELPRYTDALVTIDLSHNSLKTIPRIILWGLPWLEILTLSNNKINKLPAPGSLDQAKKSSLQILSIAHNRLKDVPSEIFLVPKLEELHLNHNQINTIKPAHIELMIGKPDLTQSAWHCPNLRELNLSNNQLIKIPSDIRGAIKLDRLDLSHNKLLEMPPPWHCPLEYLLLKDNQLDDMPDMSPFWHQCLRTLHISQNKFTKIPLPVCYLSALESLDMSGNAIKQLPAVMEWQTAGLKRLDLSNNALLHYGNKSSPQAVKTPVKQSIFKKFSSPSFSTSTERNDPSSLDKRQSNFFADIDDVFGSVTFPRSFSSTLNVLDLSFNQLEAVPQSVCDMKALQSLDLRGNSELARLPPELCLLTDLYSLKLDPGQIKDPPEVDHIVTDMKLPTRKIQKVLRDRMFDCQPYRGVKLMLVGPEKTGKTTLMTCLTGSEWPQDNKGVNVTEWMLPKPTPDDRRRTSSTTSFIGSSRLRRFGRSQSLPAEEIMFTVWDLKGGENYALIHQSLFTPRALYLLVWDIGDREAGIEKLRPWLLNIQSRAPQSAIITVGTHLDQLLEYKEQTLEGLHETIQETFPDMQENYLEVAALNVNGEGVDDLKHLIYDTALEMMFHKEHGPIRETELLVGRKVPQVFHVLKDRLSKELVSRQSSKPPIPPLMTEDELGHIIRESPTKQIQSAEQLEEAVAFLQDSGSLIHVSDHTYRLTNVYFLDPAWLCSVLFAVVQLHDDYYLHDGIVPKSRLEELCQKCGFGNRRLEEYLQLLMRFEIVLPIGLNRYLVPSLLPKGRPVFDRTAKSVFKHTLMRWYRMSHIPPGFWSRLVARLMVNVKNMDAKKTIKRRSSSLRRFSEEGSLHLRQANSAVWQEGMHIYHNGGQIQIEPMRFPDRRPGIRITVRDKRGVFTPMGFVVDHVETLLSEWYPGLEESRFDGTTHVQRLIPCPTCLEMIRNETGSDDRINEFDSIKVFPLEDLAIAAAMDGKNETECDMHKEMLVPLRALVPDLFLVDLGVKILETSKLTIGRKLGSGGFGEVFKAEYDGEPVAVKMLMKGGKQQNQQSYGDAISGDTLDETPVNDEIRMLAVINTFPKLRGEVAVMSRLKHPCILQLIGASVNRLLFAMEFAPMGDLASELHLQYVCSRPAFVCDGAVKGTLLPQMITYKIALQVMAAIAYLHNSRIIHTDLKTDNILLFSLDPEEAINVKLADYGISHNLDAGGVRGEAGFHAFSAPEILKGKAFDEKVDMFSFGMLLYHIMSGVLPFHDLQNSVETKAAVTSGVRPSLQFKEYSMLPRFFHLENLMTSCWQDSPDARPHAKEALHSMRSASFLCLRNVLKLESDSEVCLYGSALDNSDQSQNQYRMWLWRGHEERRSFIEFNVEHSEDSEVVSNEWPGPQVRCAVQVDDLHIHGTTANGENSVNVFAMTGSGSGSDISLAHQAELIVPSEIVSTCYVSCAQQKSDDPFGYLFAGLQDGTVIIFVHQSSVDDPTSDWNQFEVLKLGNKKVCTCMKHIAEKNEVWVGCGNTIRIISVPSMNLDADVIRPNADEGPSVQGFAFKNGFLWCFTNGSPFVMQYSVSSRKLVDIIDCGNVVMCKGEVLSMRDTLTLTGEISNAASKINGSVGKARGGDPNGGIRDDVIEEEQLDDMSGIPDAATVRPLKQSSTLPPRKREHISADRKRLGISVAAVFDNNQPESTAVAKIHSIEVVKDTLWVGRDLGDVLVVSLAENHGYECGQVVAILSLTGMLASPVNHLYRVGVDRVVVCQEIVGDSGLFKHHVLVWKSWGTEEFKQFDNVHAALESSMKRFK